ncbi:toll/interleukin-1 receptor domain-containing protein [Piscinibacter sp.]|uniref:toll/interleukin-1 receptor domain-containing protein n=1 Tax=Piscinibacter sp. TaxID=1903157 RepID=UPI002C5AAD34|nr:toll/interleukin-1 receptor domain-containing protein [Albitalea sp.]HUG23079.1 toll/interleukin-1 receptor domain-containing protein [Albitalea sp.]
MPGTPHVFISYSRKDYYFAESLTFHLLKAGVPAWLDVKELTPGVEWERDLMRAIEDAGVVVLVASPAALRSPNVRAEWQHALALGKRIIVLGWFARVRLPAQLQHCESVDFRGRFSGALSRLLARLGSAAPSRGGIGPLPRVPPAVAAELVALAMPIVGYAIVVAPHTHLDPSDPQMMGLDAVGQGVLLAVFALALIWALCLSLVQRRMGMTRLLVSLGFVAAPFALAIGKLHWGGVQGLGDMDPGIARTVVEHWRLGLAFVAFPVAGAVLLLAVRPGDLLRWMPTGKVWTAYRTDQAATLRADVVDAPQAFARLQRFRLLHDAADGPAAAQLRDELARAGATPAGPDDATATAVLLVTSGTRLRWLDEQAASLADRPLLAVVGSAIALPESLGWLWKRQWVDFRRWELSRPGKRQGLPAVPEAVGAPRPPAAVSAVHRVLCAFGAGLFAIGGALQPEAAAQGETLSTAEFIGASAAICGLLAMVPARALRRRTMTAPVFARWACGVVAAGVLLGGAAVVLLVDLHGIGPRAAAAVVALAALPWLAWRRRADVAFWFPQPVPGPPAGRLTPPGEWRSLATFALFAVIWMLLLDPTAME